MDKTVTTFWWYAGLGAITSVILIYLHTNPELQVNQHGKYGANGFLIAALIATFGIMLTSIDADPISSKKIEKSCIQITKFFLICSFVAAVGTMVEFGIRFMLIMAQITNMIS